MKCAEIGFTTFTRLKGKANMKTLINKSAVLLTLLLTFFFSTESFAQNRFPNIDVSSRLVKMNVAEITLETINFRNQTANLSVAVDVSKTLIPVSLKDFDYRLNLYNSEILEGNYGDLRLNGNRATRLNLPVTVNLGSIPGVVWQAFRNRGSIRYQLDAGFTLPLYVTEKRFDKTFAGEVPLKSLVDAASILRASQFGRFR